MKSIINFLREVADLIFPPKCLICGDFKGSDFCDDCYEKIPDYYGEEVIIDGIEKVYIAGKYSSILEKSIRLLKFHNKKNIAKILAKYLVKKIQNIDIDFDEYVFVPIPLHKKRLKERGYNQCRYVLEEAKKILPQIKIADKNIFIRIKNTKHFYDLTLNQREEKIKNAFKIVDKKYFKEKKIIIFDDILTTGMTLREAAKTFREVGAEEINVIVISKA